MQTYRPRNRRSYLYWLEINPWTPEEDAQRLAMCRGGIIGAWGQMETLLSELAIRTSWCDEYRPFRDSYPYNLAGRVNYMRRVLSEPGPMREFASLGHPLLARFEEGLERRNMLAHARVRLPPGASAVFEELVPQPGGLIGYRATRMSLAMLERHAERATRLSRIAEVARHLVDGAGILPTLHQIDQWHREAQQARAP